MILLIVLGVFGKRTQEAIDQGHKKHNGRILEAIKDGENYGGYIVFSKPISNSPSWYAELFWAVVGTCKRDSDAYVIHQAHVLALGVDIDLFNVDKDVKNDELVKELHMFEEEEEKDNEKHEGLNSAFEKCDGSDSAFKKHEGSNLAFEKYEGSDSAFQKCEDVLLEAFISVCHQLQSLALASWIVGSVPEFVLTYMIRTWGVGHSKWAKQVRENSSSIFTHVLRRNGQVLSCCWTTSSPPRLDASRKSVTSWPEKVPLKCKVSHGYERLNPLCWEPSSQHPCSATTSVVTFDTCRKLVVDHCCFHKPPSHSQKQPARVPGTEFGPRKMG
ncbi:hypothetical protein JHK85_010807 [Glycine max]|nr:hypothetical protein JHK85_010807 [Glycine max]KAG5066786.1 hypothetical protein JHK86_010517 [Glycine max]